MSLTQQQLAAGHQLNVEQQADSAAFWASGFGQCVVWILLILMAVSYLGNRFASKPEPAAKAKTVATVRK